MMPPPLPLHAAAMPCACLLMPAPRLLRHYHAADIDYAITPFFGMPLYALRRHARLFFFAALHITLLFAAGSRHMLLLLRHVLPCYYASAPYHAAATMLTHAVYQRLLRLMPPAVCRFTLR